LAKEMISDTKREMRCFACLTLTIIRCWQTERPSIYNELYVSYTMYHFFLMYYTKYRTSSSCVVQKSHFFLYTNSSPEKISYPRLLSQLSPSSSSTIQPNLPPPNCLRIQEPRPHTLDELLGRRSPQRVHVRQRHEKDVARS
jgi:hypothetical protein